MYYCTCVQRVINSVFLNQEINIGQHIIYRLIWWNEQDDLLIRFLYVLARLYCTAELPSLPILVLSEFTSQSQQYLL